MLSVMLALLMMADAAPFWEALPPEQWTDQQVRQMLTNSPWATRKTAPAVEGEDFAEAQFFLASAEPIRMAEQELRRRFPPDEADPLLEEYTDFLADNAGRYIVLAVQVDNPQFLNKQRTAEMEKRSVLRVGDRKYQMVGHFPPSRWDPYLRLVFPREIQDGDTVLRFELYVPGVPGPFRTVEFPLEKLKYLGQPEM